MPDRSIQRLQNPKYSIASIDSNEDAQDVEQSNVRIESEHNGVDAPSLVLQPQAGNVDRLPQRRETVALQGLKDRHVRKTQVKGALGASVTTVVAAGAAGGVLFAMGKGALIGAAIGSVFGPVGTVAGAVIFGLGAGLLSGGIGALIGRGFGKRQAAKISPDKLMQKYAPGSKKFRQLIQKHNQNVIAQHPGAANEDPDIPIDISQQDQNKIQENFRLVLQSRLTLGQPVTKRFLEETVVKLARHQTDRSLSGDDKQAVSDHFDEMLQDRVARRQPITASWINNVLSNATLCRQSIANNQDLSDQDINRVKSGLEGIVDAAKEGGQTVKPELLAHVRDTLVSISSKDGLSNDQKGAISEGVCHAVRYGLGKKQQQVNNDFVTGVSRGYLTINEAGLNPQTTEGLNRDFHAHIKTGFHTDMQGSGYSQITTASGPAIASGMVKIAKANLSQDQQTAALHGYNKAIGLERGMMRSVKPEFAMQVATTYIVAEQVLAGLDNNDQLDDPDRKGIREIFRSQIQGAILAEKDTSSEAQQALLNRLVTDSTTPLATDSDEQVHQLRQQARQAALSLVDVLADPQSTEKQIMLAVEKSLATSRRHLVSRTNVGLTHDGQPNLRSNGERRRGGGIANDDYFQAFDQQFEHALAERNIDESQAKAIFTSLMSGKARTLIFANNLMSQDVRFSKEDRPELSYTYGATTLVGQGLQVVLLQLATQGKVTDLALQQFKALSDVASQNYSAMGKMQTFVESKFPRNLQPNSGNRVDRKVLQHARSEVLRKYRHTREYQQVSDYRFDINHTPIEYETQHAAGLTGDLDKAKAALLETVPLMISTIASMDQMMRKHDAAVRDRRQQQQVDVDE